jgi:hypothetical protein
VAAIVPLTEPHSGFTRRGPAQYDQRPTAANDPDLTPEVKGITDQASIDDWDAPFPFDLKRLRDQDDTYWDHHRTTPKAYVSLATGQRLWGSRFGNVTSIRIPAAAGMTAESLERELLAELERSGQRLGFAFQPIKRQSLEASAGTTPFDVLFLLLSMFIIAAALMLVWLLFRLGVEQRAGEIGLLLALGWRRSMVRQAFLLEGGLVAAVGAIVGIAAGVGYAWLMIVGLSTWWVGAIASPFLDLYVTPLSLAIGFLAGLAVSLQTIWLSLGRVKRAVVRSLLAGEIVVAEGSGFRVQGSGQRSRESGAGNRDSGSGTHDLTLRYKPPPLCSSPLPSALPSTPPRWVAKHRPARCSARGRRCWCRCSYLSSRGYVRPAAAARCWEDIRWANSPFAARDGTWAAALRRSPSWPRQRFSSWQ